MVKINGWCQRTLTGLGKCWLIEVPDQVGSPVYLQRTFCLVQVYTYDTIYYVFRVSMAQAHF